VPEPPTPLLVFADDWGRHPSSCQHLVRHLLPHHPVTWVNTIGMRPPRLNLATARRGWEKARQWLRPAPPAAGPAAANPRVLNPRMWPWVRTRLDRALNRRLLLRQLLPAVRALPEPPVVVTTVPVVADLIGALPARRWVYYCVDDFGAWPGLDHAAVRQLEGLLVHRADEVIAVSETLQARMAELGRAARLLTHGVDVGSWAGAGTDAPPALANLPRPLVVFWGMVDRRMDVAFVGRLAEELAEGTVVLAGPVADPDPALLRLPRVAVLGSLSFEQLPALARAAAVLVMPYADLPVTRAMQPLKLKEYLATGKPAVVRDLPAARGWADTLDLAATPEAFAHAVRVRLRTGLPPGQRAARARLAGESWAAKARAFERWALARAPEAAAC
jgi:glycosyltransferase involved in cell wall biosynthesis